MNLICVFSFENIFANSSFGSEESHDFKFVSSNSNWFTQGKLVNFIKLVVSWEIIIRGNFFTRPLTLILWYSLIISFIFVYITSNFVWSLRRRKNAIKVESLMKTFFIWEFYLWTEQLEILLNQKSESMSHHCRYFRKEKDWVMYRFLKWIDGLLKSIQRKSLSRYLKFPEVIFNF